MPAYLCARRTPWAAVPFLMLLIIMTAAQAKPCFWLFNATEGVKSLLTLDPRWATAACPSNRFTYTVTNANGNTAQFTSIRYPILEFTPAVTDLSSSAVRYEHVDVNVVCDAFTPLCDWAAVYFVVRPAPTPVTPVVCHPLPKITVEFGQHGATRLMPYIENCAAPEIHITATHGPNGAPADDIFAIHIHRNEPWLAFDPYETNKQEGHYDATLAVDCGGTSCTLAQEVTAVPKPVVPTPSCNRDYGFRASFGALVHERIVLHEEDIALCPYGEAAQFTFESSTPPQYNPQEFNLDRASGNFTYHAPGGPGVKQDGFTFVLRCTASTAAEPHELCVGHAALLITAAPPPPILPQCPGDFQFTYTLAEGGAAIEPQAFALRDRAVRGGGDTGDAERFCPSGEFTSAIITAGPNSGALSAWEAASGRFVYQTSTPAVGDNRDRFNFTLGCTDATMRCAGTATLSIVAARDDRPVYRAWQDTIICRGTCDAAAWKSSPAFAGAAFFDDGPSPVPGVAHVTPRKDGRATDELSFEFTADGELLIRAYTTIGNMAARFVTFTPLAPADGAGLLTSSCVPRGSHVSFNASCLDRQGVEGGAASVWTWTDPALLVGHVNLLTEAYKSGSNYYQKFGGKHRACDVFRDDPCQYAPMLTPPTRHAEAEGGVHWTLYINDCDATWVGRATVETLRAMRQPDGRPTFTLVSGSHLRGTVYSQAVKPADWSVPGRGIAASTRAYDVLLSFRNIVDIDTVEVDAPSGDDDGMELGSDVVVRSGRVTATNERLFVYSLLLYPYENHAGSIVNVNTSLVTLSAIRLLNASWTSPNAVECPHCTGTRSICHGTGDNVYDTDCGADALMTFTPLSGFGYELDNPVEMGARAAFVPSTSLADRYMYNLTFAVRANGKDSAISADASPVGVFYLRLTLSTGHSFIVTVNQTDYISQINTRFLDMEMCRASAYWPVPDPLHDSLPVKPYTNSINNTDGQAEMSTFDAPAPLTPTATCRTAITDPGNDKDNTVVLNSRTSTVQVGNTTLLVSMCAMADVYTFGVTDWVSLSLPFSTQESQSDAAATSAKLQYLLLSVNADETVPLDDLQVADGAQVHILLDGTAPPEATTDETRRWMGAGGTTAAAQTTMYYPWKTHASSLNYRRIIFVHNDTGATEPFHFAFTPGSLIYANSNVRVHMALSASVLFTTYGSSDAAHGASASTPQSWEEKFMYILTISRSTSSAIRFDTDAYTPKFVTISTPGLGRRSATALLIVLIIGVIVVLAGSIYVEVTYKRIIHNAKYHPRRPDSAVGVHYGRDGRPKSTSPGISPRAGLGGDHASAAITPTAAATIKTSFGAVQLEQRRVPHDDVSEQSEAVADDATTPLAGGASVRHSRDNVRPPIGEEQVRIVDDDDEVAEF